MATSGFVRILIELLLPAALSAAAAVSHAAGANVAPKNLVDLHANSGKLSNKQCLVCHAGVLKNASPGKVRAEDVLLAKARTRYHRLHLQSKLGTPKQCADCHQSTDLREGSAAALRKQVDPAICAGCHSGGIQGAKVLYAR
ncbi:MAG: hypothetical protein A3G80_07855 [Betaproteobacteria bacterium RIFCSPLOWO2_12_FULL_62_13b]|nr:MAG: hypothetical protein A3G80_07855 [Betaproteobacteria bacterium RIFCSPLOWO2_12_FULL_62_13b]